MSGETRAGEGGRTMSIMLSTPLRIKFGEKGPPVCVREVPWELFGEPCERVSRENHGQPLAGINKRGGFDAVEAVCILTSLAWREGNSITEEQAHRILYVMTALYRRGVLAGLRSVTPTANGEPPR